MSVVNNNDQGQHIDTSSNIAGDTANLDQAPSKERQDNKDKKAAVECQPTVEQRDGFTIISWKSGPNCDQPGGFAITNGQSALVFDEAGNITQSTGQAGDSGCGGKLVTSAKNVMTKAHTIAIQATGGEQTRKSDQEGGEQTDEDAAISMLGEGNIEIEATGAEVSIGADKAVTVKSDTTLYLKSGDNIVLDANGGKGQINVHCAKWQLNAAFKEEKIEGGQWTEGAGEVTVNQTKAGSVFSINTEGSINHTIKGNYMFDVQGKYNLKGQKNICIESMLGGLSIKTKSKFSENIKGIKKTIIRGAQVSAKDKSAVWDIDIGKGKTGLKVKSAGMMDIKGFTGKNNINITGPITMRSKKLSINAVQVYLN